MGNNLKIQKDKHYTISFPNRTSFYLHTLKVKTAPKLTSITGITENSNKNTALYGHFGDGVELLPMKRSPASPSAHVDEPLIPSR